MRKSRSPRSTIAAFGLLLLSISLTASLPLSATRFAMAGVSSVGKCEAAFLAQSRVSFEKAESLYSAALTEYRIQLAVFSIRKWKLAFHGAAS